MPIRNDQAKQKAAVLKEIQKEYPGAGTGPKHVWKDSTFAFAPPSDAWLRGLKPLAGLKVRMKVKPGGGGVFDVYLAGESTAGPSAEAHVGSIKDSS